MERISNRITRHYLMFDINLDNINNFLFNSYEK